MSKSLTFIASSTFSLQHTSINRFHSHYKNRHILRSPPLITSPSPPLHPSYQRRNLLPLHHAQYFRQSPSATLTANHDEPPKAPSTPTSTDTDIACVLSHFEASDMLQFKKHAPETGCTILTVNYTVDIGHKTRTRIVILPTGIWIPPSHSQSASPPNDETLSRAALAANGPMATWTELKRMRKKNRTGAFELFIDGLTTPRRIATHSNTHAKSNDDNDGTYGSASRAVSLMPVVRNGPPTIILSGFTMHRIIDTNPHDDTVAKVNALPHHALRGNVLDICTGLGYTALRLADEDGVHRVVTIEIDDGVASLWARNPWSRRLLTHDKVECLRGDASTVLRRFSDGFFDAVVHDPPARALAGELYGGQFYRELRRVCRRGAVLFHYIGDRESRESGKLYGGVCKRLMEVGFRDVRVVDEAYGVTAVCG